MACSIFVWVHTHAHFGRVRFARVYRGDAQAIFNDHRTVDAKNNRVLHSAA